MKAAFLLGLVLGFVLVVGLGTQIIRGMHLVAKPKPDPAKVWCDAPPVDGAGRPAACD